MDTLELDKKNICKIALPCGGRFIFLAADKLELPWRRYHYCTCGKRHEMILWTDLELTCDGTALGALLSTAFYTTTTRKP